MAEHTPQPTRRDAGFTLIEILVVVFIIGVILGFATLSLGGRSLDDRIEQDARRLYQVMQLAADEAILTTAEIGFQPLEDGYAFLVRGDASWVPIENPRSPLRVHRFEIPARLRILEQTGGPPPSTQDEDEELLPAVYFFSSGELTPFTIELFVPDNPYRFRISGRIDGVLSLSQPDENDRL
ncbi:MAG: type II secretion system minor pseudopilin GspH [Oceanococcaceae bacterium]